MWSLRTLAQGKVWAHARAAGGCGRGVQAVPPSRALGALPDGSQLGPMVAYAQGWGAECWVTAVQLSFAAETLDKPQLEEWKMVLNLDAVKDFFVVEKLKICLWGSRLILPVSLSGEH